jgi:AhpD family alkylhydroperoxidase
MRIDYAKEFPGGVEAILSLEQAIRTSDLDPSLLELVKIRASQVNKCAYCLDMHSKDARARGESEQRLHLLVAPDDLFADLEEQFSPEEIATLTFQIVAINGWNRLAISQRTPVGDYRPSAGVA